MAEKSEIDLDSQSLGFLAYVCALLLSSCGAPWVHTHIQLHSYCSNGFSDAEKIGDDAEHLVVHLRFYFLAIYARLSESGKVFVCCHINKTIETTPPKLLHSTF